MKVCIYLSDANSKTTTHSIRALQDEGWRCEIIENSNELLDAAGDNDTDLILLGGPTDTVKMVIQALQSVHETGCPPIVVINHHGDEAFALDCLALGAAEVVKTKKIASSLLRRVVTRHSGVRKLEQRLLDSAKQIKALSQTDALTGLANRAHFDKMLKTTLAASHRSSRKVALLQLDLDHFKHINESLNFEAGDVLLQQLAQRVQSCLRGNELFARLGGDEFAIVLDSIQHHRDATVVAQRIIQQLDVPFDIMGQEVQCGVSVGIAISPDNADTPENLVKYTNIAMYRAKKLGRNQCCFFEEKMQAQFSKKYQMELHIREVVQKHGFQLHYQPMVLGKTQELVGFEALIRWPNGEQYYSPNEFIPVAEESQIINEIGQWVIESALQQLAIWQQRFSPSLTMSINLSPVQLNNDQLIPFIAKTLNDYDIIPQTVIFELTETALLNEKLENKERIAAISGLGCRLALDDFGTGFSSVSHLLNFPIDIVKIDRSLLPEDDSPSKRLSVLTGLTSMLRSLHHTIVGEGVETEFHHKLCNELGIRKLQGFYFSRPKDNVGIEAQWFSNSSFSAMH